MAAGPLAAGAPWNKERFWETIPYSEWNGEQVDAMLTDSPWAKEYTLRFDLTDPGERRPGFDYSEASMPGGGGYPQGGGIPGTGIPWPGGGGGRSAPSGYPGGGGRPSVKSEAYLTIRWSSALPVRQALAIEQHGRDVPPAVREELERPVQEYVIEVFGLPAIVVHNGVEELERELARFTSLEASGGPRVKADWVEVPPQGAHLSMTFRFPRKQMFAADHKEIRFHAVAGPFEIQQKFKPKNMMHRGELAL